MKKAILIISLVLASINLTYAETLTCESTIDTTTINNNLDFTKNLYEEREITPEEDDDDFLLIWYQLNNWEYYINTEFLVFLMFIFWWSFFVLFTFIQLSFKVWKSWQK